jgi:hypothetical protein
MIKSLENGKMSNTVAMARRNFECLVGVCTDLYKDEEVGCGCRTNVGDFCPRWHNVIIFLAGDPVIFCRQGPTCYRLMGGPLSGT